MTEVQAGIRVVRPDAQRVLIARDGFFQPALLLQRVAEVVMCLGKFRPKAQRDLVVRDCFLILRQTFEHIRQIVVRLGQLRFVRHGIAKMGGGLLQFALVLRMLPRLTWAVA